MATPPPPLKLRLVLLAGASIAAFSTLSKNKRVNVNSVKIYRRPSTTRCRRSEERGVLLRCWSRLAPGVTPDVSSRRRHASAEHLGAVHPAPGRADDHSGRVHGRSGHRAVDPILSQGPLLLGLWGLLPQRLRGRTVPPAG